MKYTDTTYPRHVDRIIKVCGMRDADNIRDVAALTPMLMGFIFYPGSPRYAGNLDPQVVRELPEFVHPVAVFVDAPASEITDICSRYGIKIVQLHGSETPEMCRELRDAGLTVFKAFGLSKDFNWGIVTPYEGVVQMYVFDTATPRHGGSGLHFDHNILDTYPFTTPYLLSGGIGPDDVDLVVRSMRPAMAGIDVNSRFETVPGRKDLMRLVNFIVSLRNLNENEQTPQPFWEKKQ